MAAAESDLPLYASATDKEGLDRYVSGTDLDEPFKASQIEKSKETQISNNFQAETEISNFGAKDEVPQGESPSTEFASKQKLEGYDMNDVPREADEEMQKNGQVIQKMVNIETPGVAIVVENAVYEPDDGAEKQEIISEVQDLSETTLPTWKQEEIHFQSGGEKNHAVITILEQTEAKAKEQFSGGEIQKDVGDGAYLSQMNAETGRTIDNEAEVTEDFGLLEPSTDIIHSPNSAVSKVENNLQSLAEPSRKSESKYTAPDKEDLPGEESTGQDAIGIEQKDEKDLHSEVHEFGEGKLESLSLTSATDVPGREGKKERQGERNNEDFYRVPVNECVSREEARDNMSTEEKHDDPHFTRNEAKKSKAEELSLKEEEIGEDKNYDGATESMNEIADVPTSTIIGKDMTTEETYIHASSKFMEGILPTELHSQARSQERVTEEYEDGKIGISSDIAPAEMAVAVSNEHIEKASTAEVDFQEGSQEPTIAETSADKPEDMNLERSSKAVPENIDVPASSTKCIKYNSSHEVDVPAEHREQVSEAKQGEGIVLIADVSRDEVEDHKVTRTSEMALEVDKTVLGECTQLTASLKDDLILETKEVDRNEETEKSSKACADIEEPEEKEWQGTIDTGSLDEGAETIAPARDDPPKGNHKEQTEEEVKEQNSVDTAYFVRDEPEYQKSERITSESEETHEFAQVTESVSDDLPVKSKKDVPEVNQEEKKPSNASATGKEALDKENLLSIKLNERVCCLEAEVLNKNRDDLATTSSITEPVPYLSTESTEEKTAESYAPYKEETHQQEVPQEPKQLEQNKNNQPEGSEESMEAATVQVSTADDMTELSTTKETSGNLQVDSLNSGVEALAKSEETNNTDISLQPAQLQQNTSSEKSEGGKPQNQAEGQLELVNPEAETEKEVPKETMEPGDSNNSTKDQSTEQTNQTTKVDEDIKKQVPKRDNNYNDEFEIPQSSTGPEDDLHKPSEDQGGTDNLKEEENERQTEIEVEKKAKIDSSEAEEQEERDRTLESIKMTEIEEESVDFKEVSLSHETETSMTEETQSHSNAPAQLDNHKSALSCEEYETEKQTEMHEEFKPASMGEGPNQEFSKESDEKEYSDNSEPKKVTANDFSSSTSKENQVDEIIRTTEDDIATKDKFVTLPSVTGEEDSIPENKEDKNNSSSLEEQIKDPKESMKNEDQIGTGEKTEESEPNEVAGQTARDGTEEEMKTENMEKVSRETQVDDLNEEIERLISGAQNNKNVSEQSGRQGKVPTSEENEKQEEPELASAKDILQDQPKENMGKCSSENSEINNKTKEFTLLSEPEKVNEIIEGSEDDDNGKQIAKEEGVSRQEVEIQTETGEKDHHYKEQEDENDALNPKEEEEDDIGKEIAKEKGASKQQVEVPTGTGEKDHLNKEQGDENDTLNPKEEEEEEGDIAKQIAEDEGDSWQQVEIPTGTSEKDHLLKEQEDENDKLNPKEEEAGDIGEQIAEEGDASKQEEEIPKGTGEKDHLDKEQEDENDALSPKEDEEGGIRKQNAEEEFAFREEVEIPTGTDEKDRFYKEQEDENDTLNPEEEEEGDIGKQFAEEEDATKKELEIQTGTGQKDRHMEQEDENGALNPKEEEEGDIGQQIAEEEVASGQEVEIPTGIDEKDHLHMEQENENDKLNPKEEEEGDIRKQIAEEEGACRQQMEMPTRTEEKDHFIREQEHDYTLNPKEEEEGASRQELETPIGTGDKERHHREKEDENDALNPKEEEEGNCGKQIAVEEDAFRQEVGIPTGTGAKDHLPKEEEDENDTLSPKEEGEGDIGKQISQEDAASRKEVEIPTGTGKKDHLQKEQEDENDKLNPDDEEEGDIGKQIAEDASRQEMGTPTRTGETDHHHAEQEYENDTLNQREKVKESDSENREQFEARGPVEDKECEKSMDGKEESDDLCPVTSSEEDKLPEQRNDSQTNISNVEFKDEEFSSKEYAEANSLTVRDIAESTTIKEGETGEQTKPECQEHASEDKGVIVVDEVGNTSDSADFHPKLEDEPNSAEGREQQILDAEQAVPRDDPIAGSEEQREVATETLPGSVLLDAQLHDPEIQAKKDNRTETEEYMVSAKHSDNPQGAFETETTDQSNETTPETNATERERNTDDVLNQTCTEKMPQESQDSQHELDQEAELKLGVEDQKKEPHNGDETIKAVILTEEEQKEAEKVVGEETIESAQDKTITSNAKELQDSCNEDKSDADVNVKESTALSLKDPRATCSIELTQTNNTEIQEREEQPSVIETAEEEEDEGSEKLFNVSTNGAAKEPTELRDKEIVEEVSTKSDQSMETTLTEETDVTRLQDIQKDDRAKQISNITSEESTQSEVEEDTSEQDHKVHRTLGTNSSNMVSDPLTEYHQNFTKEAVTAKEVTDSQAPEEQYEMSFPQSSGEEECKDKALLTPEVEDKSISTVTIKPESSENASASQAEETCVQTEEPKPLEVCPRELAPENCLISNSNEQKKESKMATGVAGGQILEEEKSERQHQMPSSALPHEDGKSTEVRIVEENVKKVGGPEEEPIVKESCLQMDDSRLLVVSLSDPQHKENLLEEVQEEDLRSESKSGSNMDKIEAVQEEKVSYEQIPPPEKSEETRQLDTSQEEEQGISEGIGSTEERTMVAEPLEGSPITTEEEPFQKEELKELEIHQLHDTAHEDAGKLRKEKPEEQHAPLNEHGDSLNFKELEENVKGVEVPEEKPKETEESCLQGEESMLPAISESELREKEQNRQEIEGKDLASEANSVSNYAISEIIEAAVERDEMRSFETAPVEKSDELPHSKPSKEEHEVSAITKSEEGNQKEVEVLREVAQTTEDQSLKMEELKEQAISTPSLQDEEDKEEMPKEENKTEVSKDSWVTYSKIVVPGVNNSTRAPELENFKEQTETPSATALPLQKQKHETLAIMKQLRGNSVEAEIPENESMPRKEDSLQAEDSRELESSQVGQIYNDTEEDKPKQAVKEEDGETDHARGEENEPPSEEDKPKEAVKEEDGETDHARGEENEPPSEEDKSKEAVKEEDGETDHARGEENEPPTGFDSHISAKIMDDTEEDKPKEAVKEEDGETDDARGEENEPPSGFDSHISAKIMDDTLSPKSGFSLEKDERGEDIFRSAEQVHAYEPAAESKESEIIKKHPERGTATFLAEEEYMKAANSADINQNDVESKEISENKEDAKKSRKEHEPVAEGGLGSTEEIPKEEAQDIENVNISEMARNLIHVDTRTMEFLHQATAENHAIKEDSACESQIEENNIKRVGNVLHNESKRTEAISDACRTKMVAEKESSLEVPPKECSAEIGEEIQHDDMISYDCNKMQIPKEEEFFEAKEPIISTDKEQVQEVPRYLGTGDSAEATARIEAEKIPDDKKQQIDEQKETEFKHSLFNMMQRSTEERQEAGELAELKETMEVHEEAYLQAEAGKSEKHKSDEEKDDEEEEQEGHKNADPGSDGLVMVEACKDTELKAPHRKKSHNILSGMGSKVKHSISKVKKVITGKSSHSKQHSPK